MFSISLTITSIANRLPVDHTCRAQVCESPGCQQVFDYSRNPLVETRGAPSWNLAKQCRSKQVDHSRILAALLAITHLR